MHSWWIRGNAVFFFGLGVLGLLSVLNVYSVDWLPPGGPDVRRFEVHDLRRLHQLRSSDRAVVTFNMDVDFAPLWNWNVKQIFVFVMADYKGATTRRNGVVLFDSILVSKDQARILGTDVIKYPLEDATDDLRDMSVSFKIAYDVHPLFGPLGLFGTGRKTIPLVDRAKSIHNYTFPTVYN